MSHQAKPKYGYVAIRPFAIMGMLGILGLLLAILAFFFTPPLNWVLWIIGIPLAFFGLWLGIAYAALYKSVFKVDHAGLFWSTFTGFDKTLRGDEHILDVGCGTGRITIGLAKLLDTGHVVGIDIFKWVSGDSPDIPTENARIEGVSGKAEFRHGDATEIPFEDETFDMVTMGSVLHEIEDEELKIKALSEVYRVLKPGGRFVTLELIRNRKMFGWLLFFAFVFKPLDYWNTLFAAHTDFELNEPQIIPGRLDSAVYIIKKPVTAK